jgi:hypothetical protein
MGATHDRISHPHASPGLVLAVAASFSALSSTASFAFTAEAQQMCTSDAFRLYSSEIPNIPKITACMIKHRADLSTGCRMVMDKDLAQKPSTSRPSDRNCRTALLEFVKSSCPERTRAVTTCFFWCRTACFPAPICVLVAH